MITTTIARFLVPAVLLISPVAASAQTSSSTKATQVAENNVAAPTTASAAVVAAPVQAQQPEKKICKRLASSYSHMNTRACLTAKEWKQVEENDQ
jgi:hypothetical protein